MTADLPEWMKVGARVIVQVNGRDPGTPRPGLVMKVLSRDLVVSTGGRNGEYRVHRDHFTDDGLGGHYDRTNYQGSWNIFHTLVFPSGHPRAEAAMAGRAVREAFLDLQAAMDQATKARADATDYLGLYRMPTELSVDLLDALTLVTGAASRATTALATARSKTQVFRTLEARAQERMA